jgi:arginine decarboxylase
MAKNYGEIYNILGWGDTYFMVNSHGHLCAKPHGRDTTPGQEIDVHSVIEKVLAGTTNDNKKVQFPMILRFPDVLRSRLGSLHAAFKGAIADAGYKNRYQGVYPIKVNQNKDIIQDLVRFGHDESYGLEAGSKPELLVAMGCLAKAKPGAYLVCNGYKDADFISLALSARAMGLNCIIVLEMEEELDIVVEQSARLGIEPAIGIRAKLLTKIPGHFGSTAGKRGKFGLLEEKIYGVAERLKKMDKLHWLTMLHFHIGSMIPTAEIVHEAVGEAAGVYCNLVTRYGAPMGVLDCGGGLGVDYDGTRSGDSDMSVAYGLEEYAASVVRAARQRCDDAGVAHPVLCTESGRAMVTHHSMIILEALSAIPEPPEEETCEQLMKKIQDLSSKQQPRTTAINVGGPGLYSHAAELQKQGIEMYKLAKKMCKRVTSDASTIYNYHMNLSVFSLVADYWGVGQLFPMMPVSRLDEPPTLRGTLVDITCDSDGKVNKFIGGGETLPLHPLDPERGAYYLAVLLSGSYQEALACKHNLFGGPTLVRVESTGDDGGAFNFKVVSVKMGPTTEEIIGTMRFDVQEDIGSAIEELAKKNNLWVNVEPIVAKGLATMPYLNEYKVPKTT